MFAAPIAAVRVWCCGDILKKGDKNLVEGHTELSPKSDITSLDFSVELNSAYICRSSCKVKEKKSADISFKRSERFFASDLWEVFE